MSSELGVRRFEYSAISFSEHRTNNSKLRNEVKHGGMAEWFKAAVLPARGGSAFGGKTGQGSSGLICLVFMFYIVETEVDFMLVRVERVTLMCV